jgi:hypothetical protein
MSNLFFITHTQDFFSIYMKFSILIFDFNGHN